MPNEAIDAGLATFVKMCRVSYGQDFDPLRVVTQRPEFDDPTPYQEYFRAPIEYSAPENVLYFSKESLEAHLPTANPRLARINEQAQRAGAVVRHLRNLVKKRDSVRAFRHRRNFGLSEALNTGFRNIRGDYIVFLPADLQSDPREDIPKLIAELQGGNGEPFVLPDGGMSLQELERSLVRQALDRTGASGGARGSSSSRSCTTGSAATCSAWTRTTSTGSRRSAARSSTRSTSARTGIATWWSWRRGAVSR